MAHPIICNGAALRHNAPLASAVGTIVLLQTPAVLRGESLEVWRGERCLFEGLDFELASGGLAVVVGPNGAGKTTLLRTLAGLAPPTAGRATWGGTEVRALAAEARGQIAYRGHLDALKKELTVVENLAFFRALAPAAAPLEPLLEELSLEHVADVRVRYLSAGQRRRTGLAALKLGGARLWILDEPTTNLDASGRELLAHWVRRHLDDGGLAVIATHQPDLFAGPGAVVIEL